MTAEPLDNPILNSPYDPPDRHFAIGHHGPTGEILKGRRLSESFIPIPSSRKGKGSGEQEALDFDLTGERREVNSLINDIRHQVELWRARRYPGVTPISRKLLEHWAGQADVREDRMLFCHREAAETAIYLAEVLRGPGLREQEWSSPDPPSPVAIRPVVDTPTRHHHSFHAPPFIHRP
ncbi:MAG: hypothetical protein JJU45_16460 [Acidimicrobiia bacterium]|nr:hypothetical protein [Acidimicrobiia bacterium]